MPTIKPFNAVRPVQGMAEKVAALPYDVLDTEEARAIARGNPYTFLRVDKGEIDLKPGTDPHAPQVYEKARDNLQDMIAQGLFLQDEGPCYYIYRLTMAGHVQVGLVACTAVDDYLHNRVKKHEYTRPDKEEDRVKHVDYCNAQTGPIFLTYQGQERVDSILGQWMAQTLPLYDFVAENGVGHTVWAVADNEAIGELTKAFAGVESFYIADGHHRCAAAARVAQERRQAHPGFTGEEEYNYFLSVLFPAGQLKIMDYNRVVGDLNGLTAARFLESLEAGFHVEREEGPYRPVTKGTFGMYLEGKWYKLAFKGPLGDQEQEPDPVKSLDVSLLQDKVLGPILGIEDPRTDPRIDFIGGIRGLEELEKRVASGWAVAFALYPTTIEEVMAIADAGRVMPPKSTWFEPKLLSGLFIHPLE